MGVLFRGYKEQKPWHTAWNFKLWLSDLEGLGSTSTLNKAITRHQYSYTYEFISKKGLSKLRSSTRRHLRVEESCKKGQQKSLRQRDSEAQERGSSFTRIIYHMRSSGQVYL